MPKNQDVGGRSTRHTERAFIAVATDLFAEKGYYGTSITDLAQALGLTTASLYYHINGKPELLFRVLETGMANFLTRLEEIDGAETDPRTKLRRAVENHLDFVLNNQKAVAVFLRERRFLEPEYRDLHQSRIDRYDHLFTEIVQRAMEEKEIPAGDPTLVRLSILGMINWVVEWYSPDGRLQQADILDAMTRLIMDQMLCRPASVPELNGQSPQT